MAWTFVLTDLSGASLGEVTNADDRKIVLPHMRVPTVSFTVRLDHYLADTILNTDTLLKCYRNGALVFNGPVISADENGETLGQTIAVNAAGPLWRLAHRAIPGTLSKTGVGYGTSGSPMDLGLIAHNVLTDVNGSNFTGISVGSRAASQNGYVLWRQIKMAADAIAELHVGLGSFEFEVAPTEPTGVAGVGGWPQIGVMNIAPLIGTTKPDAIFEYGTTRANVASYQRSVSRDGLLTRAIVSAPAWPDGTAADLVIRTDAPTLASRGWFEDVVPDGGVSVDAARQQLADFHLGIRKDPRNVVTFRPATNATPQPLVDYVVGDTVRAIIQIGGATRLNASLRVWGITFNVDKNNAENVELELVTP